MHTSVLLDSAQMQQAIIDLAGQIKAKVTDAPLAIVGLVRRGDVLAQRIAACLQQMGQECVVGKLDVSLYRDDLSRREVPPALHSSSLEFGIDDAHIILVDDVLMSGRTIRAALDALHDYGRAKRIELAVLVERKGLRQMPIHADYCHIKVDDEEVAEIIMRIKPIDDSDEVIQINL